MSAVGLPQPLDPASRLPKTEVERMLSLLRQTQLPEEEIVPDAGWAYGISLQRLKELKEEWLERWSFDDFLKDISQWNHYTVQIEGISVHFIHQKSGVEGSIPLIMTHGWPGSFYEFHKVVGPLSKAGKEGDPVFDVVLPSLPGFGFSGPPPRQGWTLTDTARVFNTLMLDVLGYDQYVAQGGDWGYVVTRSLTANHSDHCALAHFNNLLELPPTYHYPFLAAMTLLPKWAGNKVANVIMTNQEIDSFERISAFRARGLGYFAIQSTRPGTIGYALYDNPIGILSWIGEKYHSWGDPHRGVCTNAELLNIISLYFLTHTVHTAALPYYENKHTAYMHLPRQKRGRTGYSVFRFDVLGAPRAWAERVLNVVFYRYHDKGGHFAGIEMPEALMEDVREFVKDNWEEVVRVKGKL